MGNTDDVENDERITGWESVFGSIIIDNKLYEDKIIEWTIKIFVDDDPGLSIGIISVHSSNNNHDMLNGNCFLPDIDYHTLKYYGLYISNNCAILDTHNTSNYDTDYNTHLILEEDNIITLKLNMKNKTIQYWVN